MKSKKKIIWCLIALLIVGLAAWRLWPRSIDSFLEHPGRGADRISCDIRFESVGEHGALVTHKYSIETETDEECRELLNILHKGRLQASFRNLMPWTWGHGITRTGLGEDIYMVIIYDGDEPGAESIYLSAHHYSGNHGWINGRIAYPISDDMFDELAEYIRDNGVLDE